MAKYSSSMVSHRTMSFPKRYPSATSSWTQLNATARSSRAKLAPTYLFAVGEAGFWWGIWGRDQLCNAAATKSKSDPEISIYL